MAKDKRKYNSDVIDIEGIFDGTDQDQGPEVDLFDTTSVGQAIKKSKAKKDDSEVIKVQEVGKDGKPKKPSFSWDKPWGFTDEEKKEKSFKLDPAVAKKAKEMGSRETAPKQQKIRVKKSNSSLTPTQVMEGRAAARKLESEGKVAPISDKVMNKVFKDSVEAEKKKPKFSEMRKRSRSAKEESVNADIKYGKDMDDIDAEFKKLKMQR